MMERFRNRVFNFMDVVSELCCCDRFSDVEVVGQSSYRRVLSAHRVVLGAVSPFLQKLFIDVPQGEVATLIVPDVDAEIMEIIITLWYTGTIQQDDVECRHIVDCLRLFGVDFDVETATPAVPASVKCDTYGGVVDNVTDRSLYHIENISSGVTANGTGSNDDYFSQCDLSIVKTEILDDGGELLKLLRDCGGQYEEVSSSVGAVSNFRTMEFPVSVGNPVSTERSDRVATSSSDVKCGNMVSVYGAPTPSSVSPLTSRFVCEVCKCTFSTHFNLQRHFRNLHQVRQDEENVEVFRARLKCPECTFSVMSNNRRAADKMASHIRNHRNNELAPVSVNNTGPTEKFTGDSLLNGVLTAL